VFTSIAMKAPCTSGTWRSDQRLKGAVVVRHRADQHHVADRNQIARDLGLAAQLAALGQPLARPGHVLGRDEMTVLVVHRRLRCRCGRRSRRLPARRPGTSLATSRGTSTSAKASRQVASRQHLGGQRLAGAAPDALAAVILLQPVAQRGGGGFLQVGVDGRADGQAAREELILAENAGQLAADLVGEIVRGGSASRKASKSPFCTDSSGFSFSDR
jgi:hypothetical protein